MLRWTLLAALVMGAQAARADATLDSMLAKGAVVLVENDAKGHFASATGIVAVDAPIEKVWATILDFGSYSEFVPKVVESKIVSGAGTNELRVHWEIEVPGPNTTYTLAYHVDPEKKSIEVEQVEGDLKGSRWGWRLEQVSPTRTLIHHRSAAKHFSSILESAEDESKSITIGVNVGGALALLRALKARAEKA